MSEKPDLVTFVRDRLAEREALAKAVADYNGHEWTPNHLRDDEDAWVVNLREDSDGHEKAYPVTEDVTDDAADYIAANDPAYVLRDIATKRAVCDGYDYAVHQVANATFTGVEDAAKILVEKQQLATLTQVLNIFATIDADHPDYNPEWRLT